MKVGIAIDHVENDETGAILNYGQMRAMAQAAYAGGLDSIWLYDHLLYRFGSEPTRGIWECWTLLSALAEATDRVELGTLVLCNPFRNPALLAKMAHTLDEISNGRLILGLGAGWHKPEFDAFGFSFERRVDRFEEALQIVNPLLKEGHVDFEGTHYQARDCVITPPGPRPEGIPLLVGARRPRMLRLVARYADQWNTAWLGDPAKLAERKEWIAQACAEEGRDPATLALTVGVSVSFPDLGEVNPLIEKPLTGTADSLAEAFYGYDEAGAAHLIIHLTPTTETAMERLAEAAHIFRREG
jgi:probable F420-dependent oxidoreductase